MTPEEMKAKCLKQIAILGRDDAEVMLVFPRIWKGQKKMRLLGRGGGPTGEPVGHVKGGTGCFFKADEILAWLAKMEKKNERKSEGDAVQNPPPETPHGD